jgi:hypothetical protein
MQTNPFIKCAGIVSVAAAMCLAASSAHAEASVRIDLSNHSFAVGSNMCVESTRFLDPSKAYTYSINGTISARGFGSAFDALYQNKKIDEVLKSTKDVLLNSAGTLPVGPIKKSYAKTVSGAALSYSNSSLIDSKGKAVFAINNFKASLGSVPLTGGFVFGKGSYIEVYVAPVIEFAPEDSRNVRETLGSVDIVVLRQVCGKGSYTVNYKTVDGTATAGDDYATKQGTLTFNEGEYSKTITVSILNLTPTDALRSFTMELSSPSKGSVLGARTVKTINITN